MKKIVEKMQKATRMIVHPGCFHADEVVATAITRLCFRMKKVYRRRPTTTDMDDGNTIVLDVGGEFSPERLNFDHHQRDCPEQPDGRPSAACSLVWPVCQAALNSGAPCHADAELLRGDHAAQAGIAAWLADVAAYDAGDPDASRPAVAEMVADFLPAYGEDNGPEDFDVAFNEAVRTIRPWIVRKIQRAVAASEAREDLALALQGTERVAVLEEFIPFQEHWDLIDDEIRFVVYPSPRGGWVARTVPTEAWGRSPRTALPKEWWGLRDRELAIRFAPDGELEEVPAEGWFCHPNGFICGGPTRDEAIKMAERAVALDPAIRKERDEAVKAASDRMRRK